MKRFAGDAAGMPLFGQPFLTGRLGRRRGLGVLPLGTAPLLVPARAVDVPVFPRELVRGTLVRSVRAAGAGGTGVPEAASSRTAGWPGTASCHTAVIPAAVCIR